MTRAAISPLSGRPAGGYRPLSPAGRRRVGGTYRPGPAVASGLTPDGKSTMSSLKSAVLVAALSVAGLVSGVGCKGMTGGGSDDAAASASASPSMKDRLVAEAEQMISKGKSMQAGATTMPSGSSSPDGTSKEGMMAEAQKLIAKGEAMLQKAKAM